MCLALARRGLGLSEPTVYERDNVASTVAGAERYVAVADTSLVISGARDPLAAWVGQRCTYRGRCIPAEPRMIDGLRRLVAESVHLTGIYEPEEIAAVARANDGSSFRFLSIPAYRSELYGWMRFTPRHPQWSRDGLTAECLGMSAIEAFVAQMLFRPAGFSLLAATGLAERLTSEGAATRSASAVIVLHQWARQSWFTGGRRLYRFWLELSRLGLSACPMSALADDPEAAEWLAHLCGVPVGAQIVNVFRVGVAPDGPTPRSPRLPANQLLV